MATGSTFEAKLLFQHNRLGANLNLANSTFEGDVTDLDGTSAASVLLNGVTTQGTVLLSQATVTDSIDLTAARIGRSLYIKELAGARRIAPKVRLLGASIGKSLELWWSDVRGGLEMTGTRITRDVVLAGATLGRAALDDVEIGGALVLATTRDDAAGWGPQGSLDLRGSHVGTLVDNLRAWPSIGDGEPDRMRIEIGDLTYDNWQVRNDGGSLRERPPGWFLGWLPGGDAFDEQPYVQLRAFLQRKSLLDVADAVKFQQWEELRGRATGARWLAWSLVRYTTRYGTAHGYIQLAGVILAMTALGALVLLASRAKGQDAGEARAAPSRGWALAIGESFQRLLPFLQLVDLKNAADVQGWTRGYFAFHALIGYLLAACVTASLVLLTNWTS